MGNWSFLQLFIVAILSLLIGFIGGWLLTIYFVRKQRQEVQKEIKQMEKEQVKNMLSAFGKKPSEEQVNRLIKTVKNTKKPKKKFKK